MKSLENKWHTTVKTFEAAVNVAAAKEKHNGGFFKAENGYIVFWDNK